MDEYNTRVCYCYRDASNHKFWSEFILEGKFAREQIQEYLFDEEWFVPEQVGLNHLLTAPWNKDDHILHEIHEVEATSRQDCICSAREMVERFKQAQARDWFEVYTLLL